MRLQELVAWHGVTDHLSASDSRGCPVGKEAVGLGSPFFLAVMVGTQWPAVWLLVSISY